MKVILRKIILSAFLMLIVNVAYNQGGPYSESGEADVKGTIFGKVIEASSEIPMEYTSIAVYRLVDSSLVTGTVSNKEGVFKLEDVPYGKYYIEVKFIGYEKAVLSPVSLSRETRNIDLGKLELALGTEAIDEVEIIADRRRVEYKIDKKVVNVSQDLNAAGGTAVDVLENTPSVSVDIEGNVTMRGSGNFTVLIDGKPTVLEGADALRQIPASTIENIEIITNPSVKYDPDGNGGIINVVMKEQVQKGLNGLVNASVGLNDKYNIDALINRRSEKLDYFIGGGYSDNRYFGSLTRQNITYQEDGTEQYKDAEGNFDFIRGGAQMKGGVDYKINPKSNISLEANAGKYDFGIDRSNTTSEYSLPETTETYYSNKDLMIHDRMYYSSNLNYTRTFDSAQHKLVAMANFSYSTGDGIEELEFTETDATFNPLPEAAYTRNRNVESGNNYEYRLQVDYTRPLSSGNFEAGYQARIDDNFDNFSYEEYDPDTDLWNAIGENSSNIIFFRNIQGAYAQYGGSFGKFQLQAGLRGEYTYRLIEYENFDNSYEINRFDFYPTVHMAREFNNDQQVMLSYSKRVNRPRGHFLDSIPSYIDYQTVRIGSPSLQPEYVNSVELGYQKGWGKNFLAFEAYYLNTTNLINRVTEYDSETGIFYQKFRNINEDHLVGSEMMINWKFAKWLDVNASTSLYYYRIIGELFGEEIDTENISYKANANVTFNLSSMSRIQTNFAYHGPTMTAQGGAESMYYLNLAVRQDFLKRKLSATLQVRDVFGSMKRDFTSSGEGFSQHVLMQREPRVVMLTLSYRINNYKMNPSDTRGQQSGGGMEIDGGF